MKLDHEKLLKLIEEEIFVVKYHGFSASKFSIGRHKGIDIQIVVTRDKEDFCDKPKKQQCLSED